MLRKDEVDGWVQRVLGSKVTHVVASAFGAGAATMLLASCPTWPPWAQPFCPVAASAITEAAHQIQAQAPLCDSSWCNAVAGPAYSMNLPDAGVCRCTSR